MKKYHESPKEVRKYDETKLMTESRFKLDPIAPVDLCSRFSQVTIAQFQASVAGQVFLVRSTAVPLLGDHYFLVTGPLVQKPHGLRPQGVSVPASDADHCVLDGYAPINGVIALRLNDSSDIAKFLKEHNLASLVL